MSFIVVEPADLDRLSAALRRASAPTRALIESVVAQTCTRLPNLRKSDGERITRMLDAGAWTDAALAIIACELPQWQLRRLACDDGEWHCALSRQTHMPEALDDTADGRHQNASLAVFDAFLEARRRSLAPQPRRTVPRVQPAAGQVVCVDNFA